MLHFFITYLALGAFLCLANPRIRGHLIRFWKSEKADNGLIAKLFGESLVILVVCACWPVVLFTAPKIPKKSKKVSSERPPETQIQKRSQSVRDVIPDAPAAIDSILYSNWTSEEMATALDPFIALGDTREDVQQRTGIAFRRAGRSRSRCPTVWLSSECGLRFVTAEPSEKWGVISINRDRRIIGDRVFEDCVIAEFDLPWYYPHQNAEEAEAEAEILGSALERASRRVRLEREPFWRRLWLRLTRR